MTKTLIIPDIHGKPNLLRFILSDHPNADRIIQLGDLANCVLGSQEGDLACIEIAKEYNIEVLVGNHEHPYLGGNKFWGFADLPEVKDAIHSLSYKAAASVGDVLITHAGLGPRWYSSTRTAAEMSDWLNKLWKLDPHNPLFNDCSRIRGGFQNEGGILWRDISEPIDNRFKQVFGHTKGTAHRHDNHGRWVCIDAEIPYIIED